MSPYDALTMTLDPSRPGSGHARAPRSADACAARGGRRVAASSTGVAPRQVGLWIAFGAVAAAAGLRLVQVLRRSDPSRTVSGDRGLAVPLTPGSCRLDVPVSAGLSYRLEHMSAT